MTEGWRDDLLVVRGRAGARPSMLAHRRQRQPRSQMDFGRLVERTGIEVKINRAGLDELPDLAEIGNSCDVGGICEPVAARNLNPVADLERLKPCGLWRRLSSHDEDIGAKVWVSGEQFLLR